jgi:hypothetical protein
MGLRTLAAGVFAVLAAVPRHARASGYYMLEGDLRGGVTESGALETGAGVSLYSDELQAWVSLGEPAIDGGRRIKEWWLDSLALGPTMGTLPSSMQLAGFEEPDRVGRQALWIPFRSWRFGSDYTTGRWLEWDASAHVLINTAVLTRRSPRSILFGPSVGVGANLTWWEGWRGNDSRLINTGKLTAEAGWIAGICFGDVAWTQARLLAWVDAFGLHQHQLRLQGQLGVTGVELGLPLGLELSWIMERGDDTVDLLPEQTSTVMLGLSYRVMPRSTPPDAQEILETLRSSAEGAGTDRSARLDDAPSTEASEAEPAGRDDAPSKTEDDQEPGTTPEASSEPDQPPAPAATEEPQGERGPAGPQP